MGTSDTLVVMEQCFLGSVIKKLLKTHIKIWEKISNLVGKKFQSEPVYADSDKYIKKKIKSYGGNVNITFLQQGKKYQKKIFHVNACH